MARPPIRLFKRSLAAGARPDACEPVAAAAQASALALLARSVAMGHRRLALLRLLAAVRVCAVVPESDWAYCSKLASQAAEGALRGLFAEAEKAVGMRYSTARGADAVRHRPEDAREAEIAIGGAAASI